MKNFKNSYYKLIFIEEIIQTSYLKQTHNSNLNISKKREKLYLNQPYVKLSRFFTDKHLDRVKIIT